MPKLGVDAWPEKAWGFVDEGGRWSVGKPRLVGHGRAEGFRGGEKGDSWAVGEEPLEGGKWFVGTPPQSTQKVPVSSGWGLGMLSRIGGEDLCWDGDEGYFPTQVAQ